jgi:U4/U6.U5 tri-snRNP component SNU23
MGSERAFLKAREGTIDLDSKVGKIEVINPTTIEGAKAPGFFCEVCMCLLKDSASYLDHINGKKRKLLSIPQSYSYINIAYTLSAYFVDQRALGYGMRVEKAGVDQVKNRIEMLKRKVNEATVPAASAVDDYNARLALQAAEAERLKRQKKEQAAARKREEEEAELEQMDPEIAAMMGFGGFGSKNK